MKNINVLTIISIPFLIGIYLKQFYILPSGTLQLGDICFLISFILAFLFRKIKIYKIDMPIIYFVILAMIINTTYYLIYTDTSFFVYSSYLLFSLIIILTFRVIYDYSFFEKKILLVLKGALLTQVVINIFGFGRDYGIIRYEGTFNDPNQFGYYILTSFFLLFLYSKINGTKLNIIWYFVCLFLIFQSASSGMLLGFAVFLVFSIFTPSFSPKKIIKNIVIIFFMGTISFLLVVLFKELLNLYLNLGINSNIGSRALSKFDVSGGNNIIISFLSDRNMMHIIKVPYYFIFGSGEGFWSRFLFTAYIGELHSTMISLCFYYGIIPYLFFLKWLWNNLKNTQSKFVSVFIALIVEAFTLINHRQPFFWMLFVLANHTKLKNMGNNKK